MTGTLLRTAPTIGYAKVDNRKQGIVTALVNVTNIVDSDADVVVPGAHALGLMRVKPKGVWSHDWSTPISKTVEAAEVFPGDKSLPQDLLDANAGALRVVTQFNMASEIGSESFKRVDFYGEEQEWSVGYRVHNALRGPVGALDQVYASDVEEALSLTNDDQKAWWALHQEHATKGLLDWAGKFENVNYIFDWDILEYSPVLWGASPGTRSESAKSLKQERDDRLDNIERTLDRIVVRLGGSDEPKGEGVPDASTVDLLHDLETTIGYLAASDDLADNVGRMLDISKAITDLAAQYTKDNDDDEADDDDQEVEDDEPKDDDQDAEAEGDDDVEAGTETDDEGPVDSDDALLFEYAHERSQL